MQNQNETLTFKTYLSVYALNVFFWNRCLLPPQHDKFHTKMVKERAGKMNEKHLRTLAKQDNEWNSEFPLHVFNDANAFRWQNS